MQVDPVNGPWLFGYAARGPKSLRGTDLVKVGPLGKINFLVGRNNHGKSTVLHTAAKWVHKHSRPQDDAGLEASATLMELPKRNVERAFSNWSDHLDKARAAGVLVDTDDDHVGVWVDGVYGVSALPEAITFLRNSVGLQGVHIRTQNLPGAVEGPKAHVVIPAFRELRPHSAPEPTMAGQRRRPPQLAAGEGLVAELGSWHAPVKPGTATYRVAQERWLRLREFMADVLEDRDADLEVANNQEDLHVRLSQAGEMLHINDLGDGIKQVLMIAAACILYDGRLVLLEEPEIHLHAGLQRKLMRFLAEKTDSQYIIATHSAHMLDLGGAHIFHVTHDGSSTRVSPAVRASEVRQVCQDLGYMASDLLQANYTIWVEGPSDRIYWRRWLELTAPELIEGVHFAVMTYGGYLIDGVHILDEADGPVEDLVHLLQLGRECTVIADSDKASEEAELRPTILRLKDEATHPGSGHLVTCEWVRTVENLVPRDIFCAAVLECHSVAGRVLKGSDEHGPFNDPFAGMKASTYSKVKIAQQVKPKITADCIDPQLAAEVQELAVRIRRANGFDPAGNRGAPTCERCGSVLDTNATHQHSQGAGS